MLGVVEGPMIAWICSLFSFKEKLSTNQGRKWLCHSTLVIFCFGFFFFFTLNFDGNIKNTFCFIKRFVQIAEIHLQSVRSCILNHNESLLFSSSFSYYVKEKGNCFLIPLGIMWCYKMLLLRNKRVQPFPLGKRMWPWTTLHLPKKSTLIYSCLFKFLF